MKYPVIFVIRFYQATVSPLLSSLGLIGGCRFRPTCSEYTIGMVEKYGVVSGLRKGLDQLSRCHPWS